jgi:glycosyltransferase involved in cell wall biosynthesis
MGGSNFVLFMAKELSRQFEVLIVTQRMSKLFRDKCAEHGLSYYDLESPSYTDIIFWLAYPYEIARAARRLQDLLRADDIVISVMYPMNVIASRINRNDVQIVYEPFVLFHDRLFVRDLGRLRTLFSILVKALHVREEVSCVHSAKVVLALSRFESSRIEEVYRRSATVIGEGVDINIFNRNVEPLTQYRGRTLVLHSTGFDRFKGTDLVIAAVPLILDVQPDVHFAITWTREDASRLAKYKAFLRARGVADSVTFLGTVPFEVLPKLYRSATVYIEPGADRSVSLSVKEAMACGTPAVRGTAGAEETTDGVEGFLVDPHNVGQLVERVLEICSNGNLRAQMSNAGERLVRQQFTWPKIAKNFVEAISSTFSISTLDLGEE